MQRAFAAYRGRRFADLPTYPVKGYSATFKRLKPDAAPSVSLIDGRVKCAISRLGHQLYVAGAAG